MKLTLKLLFNSGIIATVLQRCLKKQVSLGVNAVYASLLLPVLSHSGLFPWSEILNCYWYSTHMSIFQKGKEPKSAAYIFYSPWILILSRLFFILDVFDGHLLGSTDSQVKEKSTMKAIFANLLPGNSYNPIPFPL